MTRPLHPQIYTIAPHVPFADTLAAWVMANYGQPKEALAQALILVPSRRACNAMQDALLRVSDGVPLLLPRIFPLGLDDEDVDVLLASTLPEEAAHLWQTLAAQLRPSVNPVQRCLQLASMIRAHQKEMTVEQAVALADSLGGLLDDFARDGVPLEALRSAVQAEFAEHWQVSLDFLEVVIRDWPVWLRSQRLMDGVARRTQLLGMLAECWRVYPPKHPVIAAGTTGSVAATAELLKVIAHLPQGAVVLPSLDMDIPEAAWGMIEATHPQCGMKELLARLEVARDGVQELAGVGGVALSSDGAARLRLMSEALLPPAATSGWTLATDHVWMEAAVQGLTWITCEQEEQEAFVVAMHLREVLETPARTAMLVTHDRVLARQVAAVMGVFNVALDDSAGQPLLTTAPAVFLRLIVQLCASEMAPAALLALLRHPLCGLSMPLEVVRRTSRVIERKHLRGVRPEGGLDGLIHLCVMKSSDGEDAVEVQVLRALRDAIAPLWTLWQAENTAQPTPSFQHMLTVLMEVAGVLAASDEMPSSERLWGGFAGNQLALRVQSMMDHAHLVGTFAPRFLLGVIEALLGADVFRPPYPLHPRVRILSPLEARMQSADVVILGGLNDGVWPSAPTSDAWLSRSMRRGVGLTEEERSVGLSAHDFYTLACAPQVVLTRTKKSGGAPTIASRWLLRLEARLRSSEVAQEVLQQKELCVLARLDAWITPEPVQAVTPPEPCPPLDARPRELSVTRIESLMRDPYTIYASKILQLYKLDDLDKELSVSDFGDAVHKALELFYVKYPRALPENALYELLECGRQAFQSMFDTVRVRRFWWPRFERIAQDVMVEDVKRIADGRVYVRVEDTLTLPLTEHFSIHARVDRIEEYRDGAVQVIDYKTGALPAMQDIKRGLACQLYLEQMMLLRLEQSKAVRDAEYWKISGGRGGMDKRSVADEKHPISSDMVFDGVFDVVAHYNQKGSIYRSCPVPDDAPKYNDYEHLARRDEWY